MKIFFEDISTKSTGIAHGYLRILELLKSIYLEQRACTFNHVDLYVNPVIKVHILYLNLVYSITYTALVEFQCITV